jgi:hypothetical protein
VIAVPCGTWICASWSCPRFKSCCRANSKREYRLRCRHSARREKLLCSVQVHDNGLQHSQTDFEALRPGDQEQRPSAERELRSGHPARGALQEVGQVSRDLAEPEKFPREEAVDAGIGGIHLQGDNDADPEHFRLTKAQTGPNPTQERLNSEEGGRNHDCRNGFESLICVIFRFGFNIVMKVPKNVRCRSFSFVLKFFGAFRKVKTSNPSNDRKVIFQRE